MRIEIGTNLAIVIVTALSMVCVCVVWVVAPGTAAATIGAIATLATGIVVALMKNLTGQEEIKQLVKDGNGNGKKNGGD